MGSLPTGRLGRRSDNGIDLLTFLQDGMSMGLPSSNTTICYILHAHVGVSALHDAGALLQHISIARVY